MPSYERLRQCPGSFRGSVLDNGLGFRLSAGFIDVFGVGVNVLGTLTDGSDGLHDAVPCPQSRGCGVGLQLLGVLAAKNFQTNCAEQKTCTK